MNWNKTISGTLILTILILISTVGAKAYTEATINNPNSYDLTNYSVKLNLNSSNFDFSQISSCGQVFVTDPSGNNLPFWIENCNLTSQKINLWVKVPSISSGGSAEVDVRVSGEELNLSDGDATFEFFDDFNGAELDTEKWSWQANGGSYTLSNGEIEIEDGNLVSTQTFNPRVVLTIREKIPYNPQGDNTWRGRQGFNAMPSPTFDSDTYAMTIFYKGDNNQFVGEYDGSNWDMIATSISTDSYHIFKLVWSFDGAELYQDESLLGSVTSSKNPDGPDRIENRMWEGGVRDIDWVFVRKLADQEPTVTLTEKQDETGTITITILTSQNLTSNLNQAEWQIGCEWNGENNTANITLTVKDGSQTVAEFQDLEVPNGTAKHHMHMLNVTNYAHTNFNITCEVKTNDTNASQSQIKQMPNRKPIINTLECNQVSLTTDTLNCQISGEDHDGDQLTKQIKIKRVFNEETTTIARDWSENLTYKLQNEDFNQKIIVLGRISDGTATTQEKQWENPNLINKIIKAEAVDNITNQTVNIIKAEVQNWNKTYNTNPFQISLNEYVKPNETEKTITITVTDEEHYRTPTNHTVTLNANTPNQEIRMEPVKLRLKFTQPTTGVIFYQGDTWLNFTDQTQLLIIQRNMPIGKIRVVFNNYTQEYDYYNDWKTHINEEIRIINTSKTCPAIITIMNTGGSDLTGNDNNAMVRVKESNDMNSYDLIDQKYADSNGQVGLYLERDNKLYSELIKADNYETKVRQDLSEGLCERNIPINLKEAQEIRINRTGLIFLSPTPPIDSYNTDMVVYYYNPNAVTVGYGVIGNSTKLKEKYGENYSGRELEKYNSNDLTLMINPQKDFGINQSFTILLYSNGELEASIPIRSVEEFQTKIIPENESFRTSKFAKITVFLGVLILGAVMELVMGMGYETMTTGLIIMSILFANMTVVGIIIISGIVGEMIIRKEK